MYKRLCKKNVYEVQLTGYVASDKMPCSGGLWERFEEWAKEVGVEVVDPYEYAGLHPNWYSEGVSKSLVAEAELTDLIVSDSAFSKN
jgi:hypothetical protein